MVSSSGRRGWGPWKFQFYLKKIKVLLSSIQVVFKHVGQEFIQMVESKAKQGVDMEFSLVAVASNIVISFYMLECGTVLLHLCYPLYFVFNLLFLI